jgi:hypothetical protein
MEERRGEMSSRLENVDSGPSLFNSLGGPNTFLKLARQPSLSSLLGGHSVLDLAPPAIRYSGWSIFRHLDGPRDTKPSWMSMPKLNLNLNFLPIILLLATAAAVIASFAWKSMDREKKSCEYR